MGKRAEILDQIAAVATGALGWRGELSEEQRLVEDLQLDSLQAMTLLVEIENHFRLVFEPTDEAQLVTVGDVVSAVERKLGAG